MQKICPDPLIWNKIYVRLKRSWVENGQEGTHPPKPLVVDLWANSTDSEKAERWQQTLAWALEHQCYALVTKVDDEQMYSIVG